MDNPITGISAGEVIWMCIQDFNVELPKRKRKEIKRSRNPTKGFSEKRNWMIVNFCKGTGLRRHELLELKANNYVETNNRAFV